MLTVFLCFVIVSGSSYVGYVCSCYYIKRKKFFSDFIDFLNHTKTQISSFQTRLSCIFNNFDSAGSDFEKLIKSFVLKIESTEVEMPSKLSYIKQTEWEFVMQVLNAIGKTDVECECENLEAFKLKVNSLLRTADDECKSKSTLCTKLGVAVGLLIAIIIV